MYRKIIIILIFIGNVSKNVMPVVADDILIENYTIDAANRTKLRTITPSNFAGQGSRTRTFIIARALRDKFISNSGRIIIIVIGGGVTTCL